MSTFKAQCILLDKVVLLENTIELIRKQDITWLYIER